MTDKVKFKDTETVAPIIQGERTPEVLSFRAVIVMTKHAGGPVCLTDIELAFRKLGIRFVMPADVSGSVVISVNDQ